MRGGSIQEERGTHKREVCQPGEELKGEGSEREGESYVREGEKCVREDVEHIKRKNT